MTSTRVISCGLVLLAVTTMTACSSSPREGYSFATTYNDEIKTIGVPIFDNTTFSYGLENQLTEAIVTEIKRSTPWKVTDAETSQTKLTGSIIGSELKRVTTARETGLVETQAVEITVNFSWIDNRTGRTLTARRGFKTSDSFVPAGGYRERLEVGQNAAVQRLARDIVGELRSNW